jgi:protein CpxP
MMKNRTLVTALLAGTLLSGIALSPAVAGRGFGNCDQADNPRHQQRMEQRLEQMTTLLGLTATQQQQIGAIMAEQRTQHQDRFRQRREQQRHMPELDSAAPFDEAAFRARAEKRAAERIDMQVERMKTRQRIFALLTPEQQEKAEIVFQNMGKRGPGHGPGMRD